LGTEATAQGSGQRKQSEGTGGGNSYGNRLEKLAKGAGQRKPAVDFAEGKFSLTNERKAEKIKKKDSGG